MKKYKVGDTFFVESIIGFAPKNGYAKVKKILKKYAEIEFLDKNETGVYRLNLEKCRIIDCVGNQVGKVHQSKDAYEVATGIKKAAAKIYKAIAGCEGYSKLLGKSKSDLNRIAEMLDINLYE